MSGQGAGDDATIDASGATLAASSDPGADREADFPSLQRVKRDNYVRHGELARGGMGRIIRARDRRHGRPVAIKELLDSGRSPARFEREARITAGLQHPGIVPIYEAGTWPTGEPFYAMKLVEGRSLADVIAETKNLAERLALLPNVIAVADALGYSHSQHVIHRDLKPANVLVGAFGETVVIDWGLAKRLSDQDDDDSEDQPADSGPELTVAGSAVGTPAYMAPEQARGERVDERADVYALGAMLYHLLSGHRPYRDSKSASEVLARVLETGPAPIDQLADGAPPELVAIVNTAMARAPQDRYANAGEMAADLHRFQAGQLVQVHHYSTAALIGRFVRRHKAVLTAVAIMVSLLLVLGTLAVKRIVDERDRSRAASAESQRQKRVAQAARARAEAKTRALFAEQAKALVDADPTRSLAWLKRLHDTDPEWQHIAPTVAEALDSGVAKYVLNGHKGSVVCVAFVSESLLVSAGSDGSLRAWNLRERTRRVVYRHPTALLRIAVEPSGKRLVITTRDGFVFRFDTSSWKRTRLTGKGTVMLDLQYTADSRYLVGQRADALEIWTGAGVHVRTVAFTGDRIRAMALAPDSRYVYVAPTSGGVVRVDLATGARTRLFDSKQSLYSVVVSRNGDAVAGIDDTNGIRVVDASGKRLAAYAAKKLSRVLFSRDGTRLILQGTKGTIQVWPWRAGGAPTRLVKSESWIGYTLRVPHRDAYAYNSDEGTVRIVDLRSGALDILGGHRSLATFAFSRDGRLLASAGSAGFIRVWDLSALRPRVLRGNTTLIMGLTFAGNDRVVSVGAGNDSRVRELGVDGRSAIERRGGVDMHGCRRSPSRHYFACAGRSAVWLFDLRGNGPGKRIDVAKAQTLRIAADDQHIAIGTKTGELHVFALNGSDHKTTRAGATEINDVAFTRDGRVLAATGNRVLLWDVRSGEKRVLGQQEHVVFRVEVAGNWAITAGGNGTVRMWSLTDDRRQVLRGHRGRVVDIALRPHTGELATAGLDGTVRLWTMAGKPVRTFRTKGRFAKTVRFTPDGQLMVVGAHDAMHIWNLRTGSHRRLLPGHLLWHTLAISADGNTLAAPGRGGKVHLFNLASSLTHAELDRATTAVLNDSDVLSTPMKRQP